MKSKSSSEISTHEERDEMKEQLKLWRHAEKKEQWQDVPAKVKVIRSNQLTKSQYFNFYAIRKKDPKFSNTFLFLKVEIEDGICHVDMVFTLGLPPQAAYDVLTNPDNQPYSRIINHRHELLVFLLFSYHCMIQMSIITIFENVIFFPYEG